MNPGKIRSLPPEGCDFYLPVACASIRVCYESRVNPTASPASQRPWRVLGESPGQFYPGAGRRIARVEFSANRAVNPTRRERDTAHVGFSANGEVDRAWIGWASVWGVREATPSVVT
jgi:hypothetical protein